MICCAASRRFRPKGFFSRAQSRLLIASVCVILLFAARPMFAQRGGGHGGGGGHRGGGGSSRGGGRAGANWGRSRARSGIVVVSGSGARGSAWVLSFPGAGTFLRGFRGGSYEMPERPAGLVQARLGSERDEFESDGAPRHVTIGFPPDRRAWNRGVSPGRTAPVAFAGQGDAIWWASPDRGAEPASSGQQAQRSQHRWQWQVPVGQRGGREPRRLLRAWSPGPMAFRRQRI
jgi:hypothetical protein